MNDFYTFIILSTLNTKLSKFSEIERYIQTLDTILSIRKMVPNSKIVFLDNSLEPISQDKKIVIKNLVEKYIDFNNSLFSSYINSNITQKNKGLNELLMLEQAIQNLNTENLIGKRIFKISARYRLSDKFKISDYENDSYKGKIISKNTTWIFNEGEGMFSKVFFETVMWSFCSTQIEEVKKYLQKTFDNMMISGENIETSINSVIPVDKRILFSTLHVFGYMTNGDYVET